MNVISIAIVGTNNEPMFLKEFGGTDSSSSSRLSVPEAELFGLATTAETSSSTRGSSGVGRSSSLPVGTDGFSSKAKECSLRQQFTLHAALGRFEELAGPPPGIAWREPGSYGADAMWVGLLCPVEEMRVYGYMTTSKLKFMAVVEDTLSLAQPIEAKVLEGDVKKLFIRIHELFVEYTLNPFNPIDGQMISSTIFEARVSECVLKFNRTL